MGYILLLIVGAVVVIGLIVMFMGGQRRAAGRTPPYEDVTQTQPGAEEANPAASSTATDAQAEAARKHTPPA
ncbi:MAG: hypothetical protein ABIZ04_21095 [Opitutus sp.]